MPIMPKSHEMFPTLGGDRPDDEQVTVFEPDADNNVHVWMENADGDCAFDFTPDERLWLATHLLKGLKYVG